MIIQQKSAVGSDGYYPRILITAPTGSVVTVNGVVQTGIIGSVTDSYTYVCNNYGTHTVVGTLSGKSKTVTVSVDNVRDYSVAISYTLYIYKEGNECTSVSGGWVADSDGIVDGHQATVTKNSNNITLAYSSSGRWGGSMRTVNSISTQGYSYVCLDFLWTFAYPNNGGAYMSAAGRGITLCNYSSTKNYPTETRQTVRLAASSVTSGRASCKLQQYSYGYSGSIVVYNIWLE